MKKTIIISAFLTVFGFVPQAIAQSSILATLHHDGGIKTFYGTNALVEANKVADDGDVITLSSGTFLAPADAITKAVTLRGAGMEFDTLNNVEPTLIDGSLLLDIPESATNKFILEAVDLSDSVRYCGTLKNPQFIKCRMGYITYGKAGNNRIIDAQILHCIISEELYLCSNSSATLVNCYIRDPYSHDDKTSNFEFQNCVLYMVNPGEMQSSIIRNSIIVHVNGGMNTYNGKTEYYALAPTTIAYNCVGVWTREWSYRDSPVSCLFVFQTNTTNIEMPRGPICTSIFKDWDFYYVDVVSNSLGRALENFKETRLELAESFKTKYLGSDGTELGIYGGNLPFDAISTNPRITKCEVDGKTTSDGKLSVKVEVNGQK